MVDEERISFDAPQEEAQSTNKRKYILFAVVGVVVVLLLFVVAVSMTPRDNTTGTPLDATDQVETETAPQVEETEVVGTPQENDIKRGSDINVIMNAIALYINDGNQLPGTLNSTPKEISKEGLDICSLLYPQYMTVLPADPQVDNNGQILDCNIDYVTGYTLQLVDASANQWQLIITAPMQQTGEEISALRIIDKAMVDTTP